MHVTHLLCKVGSGGLGEVRWCDEGSGMKVVRCAVLGGGDRLGAARIVGCRCAILYKYSAKLSFFL